MLKEENEKIVRKNKEKSWNRQLKRRKSVTLRSIKFYAYKPSKLVCRLIIIIIYYSVHHVTRLNISNNVMDYFSRRTLYSVIYKKDQIITSQMMFHYLFKQLFNKRCNVQSVGHYHKKFKVLFDCLVDCEEKDEELKERKRV